MSGFSSAAEAVAGCEDILLQILLRLPGKSLLKFKSVSKIWLSLISTEEFALTHTQTHRQTPAALLLDDYILPLNPNRDDPLPILKAPISNSLDIPWNQVVQSCNGLLLVAPAFTSEMHGSDADIGIGYFVCNPTTKQCKTIPPRPELAGQFYLRGYYALAFDPLKSPHYKVICVRHCDEESHDIEIDVYFSEIDSWRISLAPFSDEEYVVDFTEPVFYNGAIHWYAESTESVFFSVDRETLEPWPMPRGLKDRDAVRPIPRGLKDRDANRDVSYFGESSGHLVMIVRKELKFVVFEWAADYSGWLAKYKFRLEAAAAAFPEVSEIVEEENVRVLSVVYDENEEDSVAVLSAGHVIFSCNLRNQKLKKISDCDFGSKLMRYYVLPWGISHQYYASFASI